MKARFNPHDGPQRDFFDAPMPKPIILGGMSRKVIPFPIRQALIDVPRARNSDPETSHEAAARIKASGALNRQQQLVSDAVRVHKGFTSGELAKAHAKQYGGTWQQHRPMFGRRLKELEPFHVKRGPARMCLVTKTKCITWWPL